MSENNEDQINESEPVMEAESKLEEIRKGFATIWKAIKAWSSRRQSEWILLILLVIFVGVQIVLEFLFQIPIVEFGEFTYTIQFIELPIRISGTVIKYVLWGSIVVVSLLTPILLRFIEMGLRSIATFVFYLFFPSIIIPDYIHGLLHPLLLLTAIVFQS